MNPALELRDIEMREASTLVDYSPPGDILPLNRVRALYEQLVELSIKSMTTPGDHTYKKLFKFIQLCENVLRQQGEMYLDSDDQKAIEKCLK